MKSSVLLLALAALAFSSCTSAYKTGQTPDDVYYSPARPAEEYAQTEKKDDRRYESTDEYYEDRYLHMRAQNRYRWSALDDYYYNTTPYAYTYYGSSCHSPYNSYWAWNNYYNPYSSVIVVKNPKTYTAPPSRPIAFNPNSYGGGTTTRPTSKTGGSYNSNSGTRYNNSNSNSSFSNTLKKVFTSSSSNNNSSSSSSSSTPSRSYNPSSSSSSSSSSGGSKSSSGGSSGGGSSRPNR